MGHLSVHFMAENTLHVYDQAGDAVLFKVEDWSIKIGCYRLSELTWLPTQEIVVKYGFMSKISFMVENREYIWVIRNYKHEIKNFFDSLVKTGKLVSSLTKGSVSGFIYTATRQGTAVEYTQLKGNTNLYMVQLDPSFLHKTDST